MNQLISIEKAEMTSREISDLVGARHDRVKRTIERLSSGVISEPPLVDGGKSANGVTEKVYLFFGEKGKRDSIIVVAQLCPEFTAKLVDRWQELENASKPTIPQTYAEALLEAGRLALENEKQAEQLRNAAPKVEFVDRFTHREALQNATQVAQTMGMSAVKMNRHLDDIGGIYNKAVKRGRVFCADWINGGFGKMIQNEIGYPQPMFTTFGVTKVTEIFISEGII
jgi:phage regulator Rha-like protein